MSTSFNDAVRTAIGTLAHNTAFTTRELNEYLRFGHDTARGCDVSKLVAKLVKDGILSRVGGGFGKTRWFPTTKGWKWIEEGLSSRSPRRTAVIMEAERRFEAAREKHDPKRFKRGGGYTPEEYATIARAAGLKKPPSNRAKGKASFYEFMREPPEHIFAYYALQPKGSGHARVGDAITDFMGNVLGHITWRGQESRPLGGHVVGIRMKGKNGAWYAGKCNLSSGTYCRLKRMARQPAHSPRANNVNKWSHKVKTHGNLPPGLFKRPAAAIAHGLMKASRDEAQAMSRLNFYENRAGKNLNHAGRARLDHARRLLERDAHEAHSPGWHRHPRLHSKAAKLGHRREGHHVSRSPAIKRAGAAHLWHIAKAFGPNRSYVVSIGDPYDARSKVMAILPSREELYDWIRDNVGVRVSPTHVHDMTGLKKVQALLDEKRIT